MGSWYDAPLTFVERTVTGAGPFGFLVGQNGPSPQEQLVTGGPAAVTASNAPGPTTQGTGAVAVGSPFAGAGPWLIGFGLLAGVMLLVSDSERYSEFAAALLALIVVSYFFVSYGKLTAGVTALWSGGPNLNPKGA